MLITKKKRKHVQLQEQELGGPRAAQLITQAIFLLFSP
jgi:hypothetical protein